MLCVNRHVCMLNAGHAERGGILVIMMCAEIYDFWRIKSLGDHDVCMHVHVHWYSS